MALKKLTVIPKQALLGTGLTETIPSDISLLFEFLGEAISHESPGQTIPSVQEAGGKWKEASLPETLEVLGQDAPHHFCTEVFPAAGPRAAAT